MGSVFERIINAGGVGGAINETINTVASSVGESIPQKAILIVGLLLSIFLGAFGYKYVRLLSTLIMGGVGYALGSEVLFYVARDNFGWSIPDYACYIFGGVMLALLAYLAYEKFVFALFLVAGFIGFLIGYFIYPNYFLAVAIALLVAMQTISFVRPGFVIVSSIAAGFLFIGMISAMVPDVKLLSLSEGITGKLMAFVSILIFLTIQFQVSRPDEHKEGGPKRVKIRRVYDSW
jgi:hypothetical protein